MKKIAILAVLAIVFLIAIKSSYLNTEKKSDEKVTNTFIYLDKNGNKIKASMYGTDLVEISFTKTRNKDISFKGYITKSASGSKYLSKDMSFSFWTKGEEATIFDKDENIIFDGILVK